MTGRDTEDLPLIARRLAADDEGAGGAFAGGALVKRSAIAEQVTDRIVAMIRSGNLKPGDKLPTEAQMTIAFGISRPSLREALKALTIMGMVESRQGGRYSVTDLSPTRLVAPFATMLSLPDYDVGVHFEARALVDTELARLCTRRATTAEKQRIRKLAQDGHAFYGDPVAFRLLDAEYHGAIAEGARNPLIQAMSQSLYDLHLAPRRVATAIPGVIRISVRQHCAIAEAILAGDADAAEAESRAHLDHVYASTLSAMEIDPQEDHNG